MEDSKFGNTQGSNTAIESFFNIDRIITNNQPLIAGTFKDYFLSVTDNVNINQNNAHSQDKYIYDMTIIL